MKRLALVTFVLAAALVGAFAVRAAVIGDLPAIVVTHWSNSHPMREGLLPEMAAEFNSADHKTASGHPIEIVVISCDSSVQADDLVLRVNGAGRTEEAAGTTRVRATDPTVVTPQSGDWLVDVNHRAQRDVVDLETTDNIAETWLGIVTYRAMAECLGWPDVEVGYADILASARGSRRLGQIPRLRARRMGPPPAARLHQPGHVDEWAQRARLAVFDRSRQAAR